MAAGTPMQWDASPYAGFSTVTSCLPLSNGFTPENVVNLEMMNSVQ
jgi:alpha-glucosidase